MKVFMPIELCIPAEEKVLKLEVNHKLTLKGTGCGPILVNTVYGHNLLFDGAMPLDQPMQHWLTFIEGSIHLRAI